MENLLRPQWSSIDSGDLAVVLSQTFLAAQSAGEDAVCYPNADEPRITVHYDDGRIAAVTAGPEFDAAEWATLCERIETELLESTRAIARNIAFCGYRVMGSWRSETLGVQILPPPSEAPGASVGLADHPFVVEFPVTTSANGLVTNLRRAREYRRLTALLNVFLEGQVTSILPTGHHFWAYVRKDDGGLESKWLQEGYSSGGSLADSDALSEPDDEPMAVIAAQDYYSAYGRELSRGLQVPDTLQHSFEAYHALLPLERERFDRACYWWDMKDRFWSLSQSASYGAAVTTVEALVEQPTGHGSCPACGRSRAPGPTRLFQEFLETYAAGGGLMARMRTEMYRVRSAISHGGKLMRGDLEIDWGMNPASVSDRALQGDLWRLVRIALINWLHHFSKGSNLLETSPLERGRMLSKTASTQGRPESS